MRSDFRDLGGYDQVGRGLKRLADGDRLVRIGYGLYARSATAPISRATVPQQPLPMLAAEALDRLKVKTAPSTFDRAYNEGTSTQVPTGRVIGVKGRFSRKIRYGGQNIVFERWSAEAAISSEVSDETAATRSAVDQLRLRMELDNELAADLIREANALREPGGPVCSWQFE